MKRGIEKILGASILMALLVVAGCGAGDRPSDCTKDEFFNEQTNRCTACPAISQPDCAEGCGWEVFENDNGCRQARCAPSCDVCPLGERFDEEDAVCRACPSVPNCDSFGCEGELAVDGSFRAPCPPASAYRCGECQNPEDGCQADNDGMCVDVAN